MVEDARFIQAVDAVPVGLMEMKERLMLFGLCGLMPSSVMRGEREVSGEGLLDQGTDGQVGHRGLHGRSRRSVRLCESASNAHRGSINTVGCQRTSPYASSPVRPAQAPSI